MTVGDIVISLAGHDKGKPAIVIAEINSEFVLVADGTRRTLETPKLKRKKHLRTAEQSELHTPTNAAIKKRLQQFSSVRRTYAEK